MVVCAGQREGTEAQTFFRVTAVLPVSTGVLFTWVYVFIKTHPTVTSTVCN